MIRNIERRACDIVKASVHHIEPLQVVRYSSGEYFDLHHDIGELFIEKGDKGFVEVVPTLRVFTIFVYLNTLPKDQGGETAFPYVGLDISPLQGSAVLFSNVNPNEGNAPNLRLAHSALPCKGSDVCKLGLNIWIIDTNLSRSV